MAESDKAGEQLLVAVSDQTAYVRLRDRGSFKISKALKQFGVACIDNGASKIVIDMSDCVGMDSTFMGVIAGLAFRLKKTNEGRIHMVNLSSRTRGLLSTLGLDQLVDTAMQGATPQEFSAILEQRGDSLQTLKPESGPRNETAELMLEAHENLVEASAENLPRFRDVLTFLREDIKKASSPASEQTQDSE